MRSIEFPIEPEEPIFEKCSHFSKKKRRAADFFPGFVLWVVWAESPIQN
jgi:hypothetical protein